MGSQAPKPEHDFIALLRQHGCDGRRTRGDEFEAYRKSDGVVITGYAVSHGKGKRREVKAPYIREFLKRIKEIEQEESAQTTGEQSNTDQSVALPDWQQSDWHQKNLAQQKQYESTEGSQ